jgi:ABC-type multidrug transport system permease subunit
MLPTHTTALRGTIAQGFAWVLHFTMFPLILDFQDFVSLAFVHSLSNVSIFMSSFQPPLPQLCQELFALAVEERDPEGIHSLALLGLQVQDRKLVPKLFQKPKR